MLRSTAPPHHAKTGRDGRPGAAPPKVKLKVEFFSKLLHTVERDLLYKVAAVYWATWLAT